MTYFSGEVCGQYQLKRLAKTYNAILKETLGMEPTHGDKKGYKIDMLKLHAHIVTIAIRKGHIAAEDVPDIIEYKLSLDGTNMGSRACELVALTPMNLGFPVQSYHSIFPIMLYDGKETREDLRVMLAPLNTDMNMLRQPEHLAASSCPPDKTYKCDFTLCADYFALQKILQPAKGERLPDASMAEGCTCGFCGAKRCKKTGWEGQNMRQGVWSKAPELVLQYCLLDIPLHKITFCLLHAKVRIVGSLLNKLLRQADIKNRCADLEENLKKIVPTFKITMKGQLTTTGKLAKGAKCSALQGEQVDKLLTCVRAAAIPPSQRSEAEITNAALWEGVISGIPYDKNSKKDMVRLDTHSMLWQLLVAWYDVGNNHGNITNEQKQKFKSDVAAFGWLWETTFGSHLVTPYVHIICKHGGAYLDQFQSFRPYSQEAFEASHKRHKQMYAKTNFGGGKHGDRSSVYLQIMQKLYRMQYLSIKKEMKPANSAQQTVKHRIWSYEYRQKKESDKRRKRRQRLQAKQSMTTQ